METQPFKGLVLLLILLVTVTLLINVRLVNGDTIMITPPNPTAGLPFNISGTNSAGVAEMLTVRTGGGCIGTQIYVTTVIVGSYSVTVLGLPAGQYSVSVANNTGCMNFTINPPPNNFK